MIMIIIHCGRSLASRGPHFVGAKGAAAPYMAARRGRARGHRHGDCSGPAGHAGGTVTVTPAGAVTQVVP